MSAFRKLMTIVLAVSAFGLGQSQAHAAVVIAQLLDENPPITGLTYVDGELIQSEVLGDEVFDGRNTGFFLQGGGFLMEDFAERINIFAPGGAELIGTLSLSGNVGTDFVHTSYFSAFPGGVLEPVFFPTMDLIADGTFQTVLEFAADNGDLYTFQYKNVISSVPEPATLVMFSTALFGMGLIRRRKSSH